MKTEQFTADKIHVIPLGDQWEVETQSGTSLAHTEDREEAVEAARQFAREQAIHHVILHDGEGVTEEIPVTPPQS